MEMIIRFKLFAVVFVFAQIASYACTAESATPTARISSQAVPPDTIRMPAINVTTFGAIGDGVNDDWQALQDAIDACYNTGSLPRGAVTPSKVYIPPGLYRITKSLRLRTGVNIIGAGSMRTRDTINSPWGGSTIMLARDKNMPAILIENAVHGTSIRQLRITQEPGSTLDVSSAHGIHIKGMSGKTSGFGELSMLDRLAVYELGGDGIRFGPHNASQPLMLGHLSLMRNGGNGITFIRENYGHVRAISIKGDANAGSLIAIQSVSRQANFFFETVGIESGPKGSGHLDQGILLDSASFANVLIAQLDVRVTSNRNTNAAVIRATNMNNLSPDNAGLSLRILKFVEHDTGGHQGYHYLFLDDNTAAINTGNREKGALVSDTNNRGFSTYADVIYNASWHKSSPATVYQTATGHRFSLSAGNNNTNLALRFNHSTDGATNGNVHFYDGSANKKITASLDNAGNFNIAGKLQVGATATASSVFSGTGTPEGFVTAPIGSLYMRQDGGAGTALYVKESGSGTVGWIAK